MTIPTDFAEYFTIPPDGLDCVCIMQIKEILLPEHAALGYTLEDDEKKSTRVLAGLGKVNIFVGPNNSGKSRFLRSLFHDVDSFTFRSNLADLDKANEIYVEAFNKIKEYRDGYKQFHEGSNGPRMVADFPLLEPSDWLLSNNTHHLSRLKAFLDELRVDPDKKSNAKAGTSLALIEPVVESAVKNIELISSSLFDPQDFERVYVPTLRGLRRLHEGAGSPEDLYEHKTNADYFTPQKSNTGIQREVFTGYKFYQEFKEMLLGLEEQREAAEDFQKFLSPFFDGKRVTLVPNETTKGILWIKIGDEKEREIHNLGDGLQQLIILLFTLFRYRSKKLLYFVEEPELFLHPGMQRALLDALTGDQFPNTQTFIATHSNHILDMTLNDSALSIYRVKKEIGFEVADSDKGFVVSRVSRHDRAVLEDLGVQNSSVFLSNCTIWVEGITDRFYIQKYLELYLAQRQDEQPPLRHFQEDLHYSFVEYGGSTMTHWNFANKTSEVDAEKTIAVSKLCGPAFLIMDRDGGSKEASHLELQKIFGENRSYITIGKEIENSLAPKVLAEILLNKAPKENHLPGRDILASSIQDDLTTREAIGTILDKSLAKYDLPPKYAGLSGTVKNKTNFCREIIHIMDEVDGCSTLSAEALALAEKIFCFIQENNP